MSHRQQRGHTGGQLDSLGMYVLKARRARQLRQDELARLAGLSAHAVSRIENDKSVPHPNTRRLLAEVLDVPVEQLHKRARGRAA